MRDVRRQPRYAGTRVLEARPEAHLNPTLDAFALSFGVILLAELGDKSQLMALAFAARYPARLVLVAVSLATLLVHAGSVLLGRVFAVVLPTAAIEIVAGLAFFAFAAWTLRGDALGEREAGRANRTGRWAILTIGTAFFLAELGDKTMLATVTLATTQESIGTWLGSTAGMVVADAIAIGIGAILGARMPERAIKVFAALAFVVFGTLLVAEGIGVQPTAILRIGPGEELTRTFEVTLPAVVGDPAAPALPVTIVDHTGGVTSASPSDPVDTSNPVEVVPGPANAVRITWTGGECDSHATITLKRVEISIGVTVHTDQQPVLACSAVGFRRQVVLGLNQFIPQAQFGFSTQP